MLLIFQRAAGKGRGSMRDRMLWNTEQSCRNSVVFMCGVEPYTNGHLWTGQK